MARPTTWKKLATLCLWALLIPPVQAGGGAITVEAAYISDFLYNAAGGIENGGAYLQNVDLTFELDLGRLTGGSQGRLFAYLLWNDETTFSDRYPGDAQIASNIEARQALRLYELWYERRLSEAFNLRVGLYDLNAEFDAIETAGLFLGSSHGIGAEYGQTGQNGPSIFPVTSLAARVHWQPTESTLVRYALLDGVPGDPEDPSATTIQFKSGEGVLHALELNHTLRRKTRLGLGGFLYSGEFDKLGETDILGNPLLDDGNAGIYAFAEGPLYSDPSGGRTVTAFARFGVANDELNPFGRYFGAGVVLSGFVAGRRHDRLGLAIASATTGGAFRAVAGADDRETTIELAYELRITDWLRLQPDLQYISDPGADPTLDDALVFGIRFELSPGVSFK